MARNGSGTYVPPTSSWNPAIGGQTMSSDDWNALLSDVASALTNSISTDGQTTTTGRVPFSQGAAVAGGSNAAPGLSVVGAATSGLYGATNAVGLSAGGTSVLSATNTALSLPLATAVTGALSANGGLSTTTLTASGAATLSGALNASDNAKVAGSGKTLGFYGATGAGVQTVSGSRGGNAALGSLISALAALGLIVDGTSA